MPLPPSSSAHRPTVSRHWDRQKLSRACMLVQLPPFVLPLREPAAFIACVEGVGTDGSRRHGAPAESCTSENPAESAFRTVIRSVGVAAGAVFNIAPIWQPNRRNQATPVAVIRQNLGGSLKELHFCSGIRLRGPRGRSFRA